MAQRPGRNSRQDGVLQPPTDFRKVYAAVIQDWFQCEAEPILKGNYNALDVFAATNKR